MMSLNVYLIYGKRKCKKYITTCKCEKRSFTFKQTYMAMCEGLKILENPLKVKAGKFMLAFQKWKEKFSKMTICSLRFLNSS